MKEHPYALPRLRESLGLDFAGSLSSLSSVSLATPLQPATVSVSGGGAFLKLSGARALGTAAGTPIRTVAASHGVGLGKSVSLAWNAETSSSAALYLSALAAAAPAPGAALLPGGVASVRAHVVNTGEATTSYLVTHTLGGGLTTTDPLTHALTLAPLASGSFSLLLRLPFQPGAFTVEGALSSEGLPLDADTVTLQVARSRGQIQSDVVAALQALNLSSGQANKRDQAISAVVAAGQSSWAATAIDLALQAIDRTREITAADTTAIRIDLARLLRAYQLGWQP